MRTIIRNARVVDGTGSSSFPGAVLFEQEAILAVGKCEPEWEYHREIDAKGQVVCPGFIDTHSHSDVFAVTEKAILPKLRQGITTEVLGQDGLAMAPVPVEHAADWKRNLAGLDGDAEGISWEYPSMEEYLRAIERNRPCQNYACLAAHGNIRLGVMGFSDQPATADQIRRMEESLEKQLIEGAMGMSTGLIYIPCIFASAEELTALCRVLKKYDRPFVIHQRYQNHRILESMEEIKRIVAGSGVHLHISHLQLGGKENDHLLEPLHRKIEEIESVGTGVTADVYPYIAGAGTMGIIIPSWAYKGGAARMLERLGDPASREKIKAHMLHPELNPGDENQLQLTGFDGSGLYVSSVTKMENERYVGKNLAQIGEMTKQHFLDAIMDLLIDEQNNVGLVGFHLTEERVIANLRRSEVNLCTDGVLLGTTHPRTYGAFPRLLGYYVREKGVLSLEEAVYKMTKKAADAMHIPDRGVLAAGKKADIVMFDPDTIRDVGTFSDPMHYPEGIHRVIVNGDTVFDGETVTESGSGRVIRL